MKITSISATAGRTFNHPREQYANFRFDLHFTAALEEGEDAQAALQTLQATAETAAESHKSRILSDIKRKAEIQECVDQIEYENRKAFDSEASKKRKADLEAKLTELTSTPLLLAEKQIHAGHSDHPDTDLGF